MQEKTVLNTIPEALEDLKQGKVIIVVDDENRENEGDFVAAAETCTPEMINFMITHGRGLVCAPLPEDRCQALDLDMMVGKNTDPHSTAFTVSVDLLGHGCTTGISASDRSKTIQALIDPNTQSDELARPGHIFPLKAKNEGVLRRTGHTEAAVDLSKMAGFTPGGVIVEIMNEDGTMARLPELLEIAKKFDLKIISIEDLVAYRLQQESMVRKLYTKSMQTSVGEFQMSVFEELHTDQVHVALSKGEWTDQDEVLVKVQAISNKNFLTKLVSSRESNLNDTLQLIHDKNQGVVLFIFKEYNKQEFLTLLESNFDVNHYPSVDSKDFGIGAQILSELGVKKLNLITKNKFKRVGLSGYGLQITNNSVVK